MKEIMLLVAIIASGMLASKLLADCQRNKNPSAYEFCDPSTSVMQIKTTQDQAGQQPANTWCRPDCIFNTNDCVFTQNAVAGCNPSGSYDNCWVWGSTGFQTGSYGGCIWRYAYTFVGGSPTNQGATTKYVIDNMNCGS